MKYIVGKKENKEEKGMMKKLAKTEKGVVRVIQKQNKRFKDTFRAFYPDNTVANFDFPAVDDEALDFLYDWSEIFTDKDQERRKGIENSIFRIHYNVLEGITGNVGICFDEGMIYSGHDKYEMGNIIVMICIDFKCQYYFLKEGDRFDGKIFIENDTQNAFVVLNSKEEAKDNNGEREVIFPDVLCLFGICYERENVKENAKRTVKETGIMISYEWASGKFYFDLLERVTFSPVRELLTADWLQEEWKKAKEANEKRKENMAQQQKISIQKTM